MTAACSGDWATFDAEDDASQARAKLVCSGCDVRAACLATTDGDVWFVRGGRTAAERAEPADDALFAVTAGEVAREHDRSRYTAGCRCERCEQANRTYIAEWRRRPVTAGRGFEQTGIDWEVSA